MPVYFKNKGALSTALGLSPRAMGRSQMTEAILHLLIPLIGSKNMQHCETPSNHNKSPPSPTIDGSGEVGVTYPQVGNDNLL